MIPSITMLAVSVALIGCSYAQTLEVPDGKCTWGKKRSTHPTYGNCTVYFVPQKVGRLFELNADHGTKTGSSPQNGAMGECANWKVDFVDAPNHYICIVCQLKYAICSTYCVCFYDLYQQSTENSIDFKTIEIKISTAFGKLLMCKSTTFLALTMFDSSEASVIAYRDHSALNWAENFADSGLVNLIITTLDDHYCSLWKPSSKGCQSSNWADISRCQRRLNYPTLTCNKTTVRYHISQERDIPLIGCSATKVQSIECTSEDLLTRCDLDCIMSEWTAQPCNPSQVSNGKQLCSRSLNHVIRVNQTTNGIRSEEGQRQHIGSINERDAYLYNSECKLTSWTPWYDSFNQHCLKESPKNRTRPINNEAWVPNDPRFEAMQCKSFYEEETEACVRTTTVAQRPTGKIEVTNSSAIQVSIATSQVLGTGSEKL